jgi:hypothetical protein
MTLTLQQQLKIATDGDFQGRVALGLMAIARDQLESEDDNPLRIAFASGVILNDPVILQKYAAAVVSDYDIVEGGETEPADIPDHKIIVALQYLWNYLSGADANAAYYPQHTSPMEQLRKAQSQMPEGPLQRATQSGPHSH